MLITAYTADETPALTIAPNTTYYTVPSSSSGALKSNGSDPGPQTSLQASRSSEGLDPASLALREHMLISKARPWGRYHQNRRQAQRMLACIPCTTPGLSLSFLSISGSRCRCLAEEEGQGGLRA